MYTEIEPPLMAEMAPLVRKVLLAYIECSDELQAAARDMIDTIGSTEADDDERSMAIHTLMEILFPQRSDASVPIEELDHLAAANQHDGKEALRAVEAEEATFADRLRALMQARNLIQDDLAERAGVTQPAISLMLSRDCRPQHRTVQKLAKALDVSVEDLWPAT